MNGIAFSFQKASMKVLYIAYPLLTVSGESAGGAEQMLWTLEREMAERGVSTTVAASLPYPERKRGNPLASRKHP